MRPFRKSKQNIHNKGFTLLEILVAVIIFALIILGAQRIFSMAIDSSDTLNEQQVRLNEITITLRTLENDLSQIIPRSLRSPLGGPDIYALQTDINDNFLFRLTRAGWRNPLYQSRSELQSVIYYLKNDELIRAHTLHLDSIHQDNLIEKPMITKVENFDIKFLARNGEWQIGWPLQSIDYQNTDENSGLKSSIDLPIAIEIQIEFEDVGTIRRVFALSPSA